MPKLILTVGLPASGKSTYAKELARSGVINVNRDDLRKMLFGLDTLKSYKYTGKKEQLVTDLAEGLVIKALAGSKDVIISDTNLNPSVRNRWYHIAQLYTAETEIVDFRDVDPRVCVDRDSRRRDSVGKRVIESMVEKYWDQFENQPFTKTYGAPKLDYTYVESGNLPQAIIVDIDGTVARMVDRGPYDQDRVLEDAMEDDILDLVEAYAKENGYHIIFVSGRDDKCKADTQEWLDQTQLPITDLHMRATGDARKDDIVKLEIFREKIAPFFDVVMAFDDRDQVVNMWRQIGLRCVQVSHGNF